ncbi:MAG: hypothetical protein ACW99Q_09170 [Candidatus Kariarchaeaceae archaeon]|jgi:ABC-type xylose transport system permease subunit
MSKKNHEGNSSRKMRSSKRILRGGRRYVNKQLSFGMKKKIRYRTDFQPLFIVYAIVAFLIITFFAIIFGDYRSVPPVLYLIALIGLIAVEIYILGGKRYDP